MASKPADAPPVVGGSSSVDVVVDAPADVGGGWSIAIHGGAGVINTDDPAWIAATRKGLDDALEAGVAVSKGRGRGRRDNGGGGVGREGDGGGGRQVRLAPLALTHPSSSHARTKQKTHTRSSVRAAPRSKPPSRLS